MMRRSVKVAILWAASISAAGAETPASDGQAGRAWVFDVTAFAWFLPHDPDYLQPTVTADRGALHLEARYNYEDIETFSLFVGWNAAVGESLKLEVTPMLGFVGGNTVGIAPGLELSLSWGPLELRSESEYVLPFSGLGSSFFYAWSELGVHPTEWLRAGLAEQRTRRFHSPHEVSWGPMVGFTLGKLDAAFYALEPWSSQRFAAISLGLSL
jgi:hypothetical protein